MISTLASCRANIATDFCIVYEPLLPSRSDSEATAKHLNVYYQLYKQACD